MAEVPKDCPLIASGIVNQPVSCPCYYLQECNSKKRLMTLELTVIEVGLVWEALDDYAAVCHEKQKQKAQNLEVIKAKIEKLCGDDT